MPPCPKCAVQDADNALNKPGKKQDDEDEDEDDGRPKHQGISVMKPVSRHSSSQSIGIFTLYTS